MTTRRNTHKKEKENPGCGMSHNILSDKRNISKKGLVGKSRLSIAMFFLGLCFWPPGDRTIYIYIIGARLPTGPRVVIHFVCVCVWSEQRKKKTPEVMVGETMRERYFLFEEILSKSNRVAAVAPFINCRRSQ